MYEIIFEKIKKYYERQGKTKYYYKGHLRKFFDENPDVKDYVYKKLSEDPWYKNNPVYVIYAVAHEIHGPSFCITCGKELSIESVIRGSLYCSGGCKSRDPEKKRIEKENKNRFKQIYMVDKSIQLDESVIRRFQENGNAPSNEVKEKIAEFAKHDSKGAALYKLLISESDVDEYLGNLACVCDWINDKKMAFWFAKQEIYEGVECLHCGRKLSFQKLRQGHVYCSAECSQNDERVRNKIKRTCRDKYGCENVMGSEEVKKHLKQTMADRYGVENASLSKDICEKRTHTMLDKYGVHSYTMTDEYLDKAKKTNLERYGVEWSIASRESREKQCRTRIEKYGVDNIFKSKQFQETINKKKLEFYYDKLTSKYSQYVIPLFTKEEYAGIKNGVYRWKCVKCGCEFDDYMHSNSAFRRMSPFPLCPVCFPPMIDSSFMEKEVVSFIKSIYDGCVIENDRTVISPLELDMYMPGKQLAIEFDGMYWHSEATGKNEKYHLYKTEKCFENGIKLLHVFENEWIENKEIVKDRIKAAFGIYDSRIYARKCKVRRITPTLANKFLEKNHLQGCDNSSCQYGLMYEHELVAVMTFGKPRFNKNYDWELIRYASQLGIQVIGGASKLLAKFMKNHSGSIVSYADRRYSDGRLYDAIGFRLIGKSSP